MQAALMEFAEKGYRAASINCMVEKAGIAKGSVFQYFGDKEGLFAAVFAHSLEKVKEELRKVRDNPARTDIFTRLAQIMHTGLAFTRTYPLIYRLYTQLLSTPDIPCRDFLLTRIRDEGKVFLKELLEKAAARGEIRDSLPIQEALFLLEALLDRFLLASVLPYLGNGFFDGQNLESSIPHFIDILEKGMGSSR